MTSRKSTSHRGAYAELQISARLVDLSYCVFVPLVHSSKCDLVAIKDEEVLRIQCKRGYLSDDVIIFSCVSADGSTYENEVDAIICYCDATRSCYFVPIEDCTKSKMHLRLSPAANNQTKNVNMADDFLL